MSRFLIAFLIFLLGCNSTQTHLENSAVEVEAETVSNQFVTSFIEDRYGYIWMGTTRGLNRYNGNEFTQFYFNNDSVSLPANTVTSLLYDSQNQLWVGTTTNGVGLYEEGKFKNIEIESSSKFICQILEDKKGRVIVNTSNDICVYNTKTNKFEGKISYFSKFPNPTVLNLEAIDANNRIWVATQTDISVYDENFKLIKKIPTPTARIIHSIFINSFGELWLSHSNGITVIDTEKIAIKPLPENLKSHESLPHTKISNIFDYNKRAVILKTFESEFYLYDFITNTLIHQSHKDFPFRAPDFETTTIFNDSRNNLWFGSTDKGFEMGRKSEKIFNDKFVLENALGGKSIMKIAQPKDKSLWFLTSKEGIFKYNPNDGSIVKVTLPYVNFAKNGNLFFDSEDYLWVVSGNDLFQCNASGTSIKIVKSFKFDESMSAITQDDNGSLWIAGFGEYIYFKRKEQAIFERKQFYEPGYNNTTSLMKLKSGEIGVTALGRDVFMINPNSLTTRAINIKDTATVKPFLPVSMYEDSKGLIWISTHLNGLYSYSPISKKIKSYANSKLACNDISGIIEDNQGYLWIPTQNGLSKLDPSNEKIISYFMEDGTGGNQFNFNALIKDSEGRLYFGAPHGVTEINPIKPIPDQSNKLIIEKITSDKNKLYEISSQKKLGEKVKIKDWNNSFSIHYTILNFSQLKNYHYAYKLEGYNEDWVEAGKSRQANFYKIPPGTYNFKVRASSNNQEDSFETSLTVTLLPPWWCSNSMMLLYFILLSAVSYGLHRLYRSWRSDKEQTLLAETEKQEAIKMNELNFNYFTNISHEFRTPLTMINGPVTMLSTKSFDAETLTLISIIQRNVDKMLNLVNQFLDFNNLKEGETVLKASYSNILPEIKRNIDLFTFVAREKKITLSITAAEEPIMLYLDKDKLDKILSNILSNAIKYTPAGEVIEIAVGVVDFDKKIKEQFENLSADILKLVKIDIKDTGVGIPKKDLKKVFERFYQVKHKNGLNHYGTGIGLNYSQRLVRAHHGDITALQNTHQGTIISIVLPLDETSYSSSEIIADDDLTVHLQKEIQNPLNSTDETLELTQKKEQILIVDDEPEITHFLKTILSVEFTVECVFTAEDAIQKIETFEADLIISDVLMPGMSGYDFCQYLKENIDYSHIPVILLTAKSTTQEQVKGLYQGADAYITKPFDPLYLISVIKSQINNRKKVREMLTTTTTTKKMLSASSISPHDKILLKEFYVLMNEELDNTELNIKKITEKLNISRTKFYYKIKSLTGENPASFFKTYKLNKAAEYIKTGQYNISEIAYMTGFNTLSHFSISFKKQFGVSPSEFK
jgi:signal transduction histidine kinase/ligand-binding sensor domain-containing protein/DNA-binding response OmpR family regulator